MKTIYTKEQIQKRLEATKRWQLRNPEKVKARNRRWTTSGASKRFYYKNRENILERAYTYTFKKRIQVLRHYGGEIPKCQNCGFDDIDCLALDHIHNGGNKERRANPKLNYYSWWKWIIDHNYPKDYQVLCCNCNWKKHILNLRKKKYGSKKYKYIRT